MDDNVKALISPRIKMHCLASFESGFFKESAREAMVQVEKALKEKGGKTSEKLYGVKLVRSMFGGKGTVVLKVSLDDHLQGKAEDYFAGVFSYYRNYVAHDGALVDERIATRILILASELLELIGSSELTLSDSGGVEGVIRILDIESKERLHQLLRLLDGYNMPAETYDGLFEMLAIHGYPDEMLEKVICLGLIDMRSGNAEVSFGISYPQYETREWFELTDIGNELVGRADE